MKKVILGKTSIEVSKVCLGTMTFGEQVGEVDAHNIMDLAVESGVNFIDSAEMYPIPASTTTYGTTEKIIGNWIKKKKNRESIVIATKVSGPSRGMEWIRGASSTLNAVDIIESCENSLRRLKTDYIDLYQIHWPARHAPMFGNLYFDPEKAGKGDSRLIEEQLFALDSLVHQGKVRTIGLCNETPFGVSEFIRVADKNNLANIATVQNPYCLIGRAVENGLDEILFNKKISFLGYSPLAFGLLTGKYDEFGAGDLRSPTNARLSLYESMQNQRWGKQYSQEVARIYNKLARDNGLTPVQLALAFCYQKKLVSSTLIGVTSKDNLRENLDATSIKLEPELLKKIDEIRYLKRDPV